MMFASQALGAPRLSAIRQLFGQRPESSSDANVNVNSDVLLEKPLNIRLVKMDGKDVIITFPEQEYMTQIKSDDLVLRPSSIRHFTRLKKKSGLNHSDESFLWNLAFLHESMKDLEGYKLSKFFDPNDIYYRYMLLYLVRQPEEVVKAQSAQDRWFKDVAMKYSDFVDKKRWAEEVVNKLNLIFNRDKKQKVSWITQSLVKYLLNGEWAQDAEVGSALPFIHDAISVHDTMSF